MRKIDGLRLDYLTGEASICLPAEFKGQSEEFQIQALSYWLTAMDCERDTIIKSIKKINAPFAMNGVTHKTIDDLCSDGHGVLMLTKASPETGKRFAATYTLTSRKKVYFWESCGHSRFAEIASADFGGCSIKALNRMAGRAYGAWGLARAGLTRVGIGRIVAESLAQSPTPHHMVDEIVMAAKHKATIKEAAE